MTFTALWFQPLVYRGQMTAMESPPVRMTLVASRRLLAIRIILRFTTFAVSLTGAGSCGGVEAGRFLGANRCQRVDAVQLVSTGNRRLAFSMGPGSLRDEG